MLFFFCGSDFSSLPQTGHYLMMKCTIYSRSQGCDCYRGPFIRGASLDDTWRLLLDADGAWYWCYFDPDEKTPGDAISAIASRMQPMTEAVRATFQSISARWDSESFLGPETHLILLRNMPTSLDADQLAQEFSCLEKGEPSDLLAYVVTLQDQVYSLIYFSEAVRAWVLRIAGLLCEEGCAEKPYVGFRLALSKLLPLDNWTIP